VLKESEDFENVLIFWDNHKAFGTELRFSEDMTPIVFPVFAGTISARFFMRPTGEGFGFGIEVRERWWNQFKDTCVVNPEQIELGHLDGSVRVILAILPATEFNVYHESISPRGRNNSHRIAAERQKHRLEILQRFGWSDKSRGDHDELAITFPTSLEHTYLTIEHGTV